MTKGEIIEALQGVERSLTKARDEIGGVADIIEARLRTEKELADSLIYGAVCHALGILEEQITRIGNQITKLTK